MISFAPLTLSSLCVFIHIRLRGVTKGFALGDKTCCSFQGFILILSNVLHPWFIWTHHDQASNQNQSSLHWNLFNHYFHNSYDITILRYSILSYDEFTSYCTFSGPLTCFHVFIWRREKGVQISLDFARIPLLTCSTFLNSFRTIDIGRYCNFLKYLY